MNVNINFIINRNLIFAFICIFFFNTLFAQQIGESTGFKIPRYVSLKSGEVNLRIGSSQNFPILLQYKTKNLPIEILDEYDVWRKISDINGNQGWIHETLLKGDRYAIINSSKKNKSAVFKHPNGKKIGEIGQNNIVKIKVCLDNWCHINFLQYKGWINKNEIWGVYKNEKINVPFYQPLINIIWKIK